VNGEFMMTVVRCSIFEPPARTLPSRLAECGIPFWPHGFVTVQGDMEVLVQSWPNEYACLGYGEDLVPALVDFCELSGVKAIQP
jgi:hypothetical protein